MRGPFSKQWWERRILHMYDSWRHPSAWHVTETPDGPGDLSEFPGHRFSLLVTYRRNGEPVPCGMWFGLDNGRAYLRTGEDSLKVRRIKNNQNVLFAPSDVRGRPKGAVIRCVARIVPHEEKRHAAETMMNAYGIGRKIYDRTVATVYEDAAYIEITPVALLEAERAQEKESARERR